MSENIKIFCILFFCILLFNSCSDPKLDNPFDPEVNTDFPAVNLVSVANFGLSKIEVVYFSDYEYFTRFQIERSSGKS